MGKIAINPGHHPALDPGAVGPSGLREADIALAVAARLRERLTAAGHAVVFISANELDRIAAAAISVRTGGIPIFASAGKPFSGNNKLMKGTAGIFPAVPFMSL